MNKKDIGNLGEILAEKYLIQQKYVILDKNYYIKGGEADIIVKDSETKEIVFVEVKTRTSTDYGWPEESINEKKRLRLAILSAFDFSQMHPERSEGSRGSSKKSICSQAV